MSPSAPGSPRGDAVDPAALVGRVLVDRYRVTGLLGVGGIGRVYRAEHLVLRRQVAIKVLLEHYQCVPELQRRFEREAMALAALSHPNIVTITDFVSTRDLSFLVMELIEGEELVALLDRGPMAVDDAFAVMEQMLSCLAYAHERDVIHRDLKPQNVLVRRLPGGRIHAEMLDFGLAKFMDGSGPSANLTKTGLVVGTPAYMAPEQASGSHADQRADVYAAGLMFFEMLVGVHPFDGAEGPELLRHHLLTPPPTLASRCEGAKVAPELETFIARALAKDGADRYADGGAMLEAFSALPAGAFVPGPTRRTRSQAEGSTAYAHTKPALPTAVSASRASRQRKGRRRWALAAVGAAVGLGLAAMYLTDAGESLELVAAAHDEPAVGELLAPDAPTERTEAREALEEQEEGGASEGAADDPALDDPALDDPALDEPAEAPLEEEASEETAELEPPPVRRPAARNPWAGRTPAPIAQVKRRVVRGQTITKGQMRQVARYRRQNPSDVRATLVLAHAYASRGWYSAAIDSYRRVYRRDPSARGDRRMLRDLVRIAGTESLHAEGTSALAEIYGPEARRELQRAAARERDEEIKARLTAALAQMPPTP